jgi:UDP-N-acetylglucosamine diphosphorylase/glucosamine-1-phosphate N-acetyltransferase
MRSLVVFEDAHLQAFATLTPLRGVYDLRCGGRTLLERQLDALSPDHLVLLGRPELHALQRETHSQADVGAFRSPSASDHEVWFLNGRLLVLGADLSTLAERLEDRVVLLQGDTLLLARCRSHEAPRLADFLQASLQTHTSRTLMGSGGLESWLRTELADLPIRRIASGDRLLEQGSRLIDHIWELVASTPRAIEDDARLWKGERLSPAASVHPRATLLAEENIHLGERVTIAPGAVLDASDGPILIEAGTSIQPLSYLQGPLTIGAGCVIKAGAKIHEGTALGPHCKIGGEIEESVVQGFSNKQHEGFLGHAFLGEWVNLGADTNNSDLKNNYSTVRVWESGQSIDTGLLFVGLIAGDHVKSAINTSFNTGTVVGLSSQIFGSGFPPKYVPPFTWGGIEAQDTYAYDKALATARVVMSRRDQPLSEAYEAAFQLAWERSRNDAQSA